MKKSARPGHGEGAHRKYEGIFLDSIGRWIGKKSSDAGAPLQLRTARPRTIIGSSASRAAAAGVIARPNIVRGAR